ncbi:MAG: beta-propeller fold lactonase family protein [Gammaproteobacteria bacterium]|nr:beta-propeller fold lactonase family protein [Gammaproteobacteria bacterium]
MMKFRAVSILGFLGLAVSLSAFVQADDDCDDKEALVGACDEKPFEALLPTGKIITPEAAPGSAFIRFDTELRTDDNADAEGAVAIALSPNGEKLLVLTSGYNRDFRDEKTGETFSFPVLDPVTGAPSGTTVGKSEWVFIYTLKKSEDKRHKIYSLEKTQQIGIPNTFSGLVWGPDSQRFYVSGGIDDRILTFRQEGNEFVPDAPFILLGHNSNETAPIPSYDGGLLKGAGAERMATGAVVAGLDLSKDGKTLVAANFENDSISIVDTQTRTVTNEVRFFKPGDDVATGEYPYHVVVLSDGETGQAVKAYATSQRDNEVMVVDLSTGDVKRIPVGVLPTRMTLSHDQRWLYVANGESDTISRIDTSQDQVKAIFSLARKGDHYTGSAPNALALSPDDESLYVTLGNENAVAVVSTRNGRVRGRIPTGWYPNDVSVSPEGDMLFVVNAKGVAGANPASGRTTEEGEERNTTYRNEYVYALQKAGLTSIPIPKEGTLNALSRLVDRNNGFDRWNRSDKIKRMAGRIEHVIYIIKENRTYDQVLGDLPVGNGDPDLTLFPETISPNHHQLAMDFGVYDNFYASGSVSGDGWGWSTFARTTDYTEKTVQVLYGNAGFSGLSYDYEGNNRFVLAALPNKPPAGEEATPFNTRLTTLLDPSGESSILPGSRDISAPAGADEDEEEDGGGYLWDSALRAGKTVRAYGILMDLSDVYYATSGDPTKPDPNNPVYIPITPTPFADGIQQATYSKVSLEGRTDVHFRGYDQKQPEVWSVHEWIRDVEAYATEHGTLPNLMMMALDHDHFGSFGNAVAGVNTPELQMADNDYALALIVEYLSHRPEWGKTAIFVIEDDAQNGPDHVDAQRTIGYVISPYTRGHGNVISSNYNTVSMIRTMVDLLGIDYLGINDANAAPMADAFAPKNPDLSPYIAILPGILCQAPVESDYLLGADNRCGSSDALQTTRLQLRHDNRWWAEAMADFDFEEIDHLSNPEAFNRILWEGIRGDDVPYPTVRHGRDLRQNRTAILDQWRRTTGAWVLKLANN